jgi:hypothetical protein
MIRNLKALGLALMAAFALSAMTASGASAQNQGWLTTDGTDVTLTGTETGGAGANAWTMFGGTMECPGSVYTGHKVLTVKETEEGKKHERVPNKSTTFTTTPHYKQTNDKGEPNCVVAGTGLTVTIDMNGCDYVIHIGTKIMAGEYNFTLDIVCPTGKEIATTMFHSINPKHEGTPYCTMHIPPQNGLAGGKAKNTTSGHIGLIGTVEGIEMIRTKHGSGTLLCPTNSTFKSAKWDTDVTLSGDNAEGKATEISVSDEA